MPIEPDIAVILSTYERPAHLARSLASLRLQRGVAGRFEVVVTDDGSEDETEEVVAAFARTVDFRVAFVTHRHEGFRLARCRNAGVRASRARYLLFTDGDCLFPPDHLQMHLLARRPGVARAGSCYRLTREATERLDTSAIAAGAYRYGIARGERRRMLLRRVGDFLAGLRRHPTKPKLAGWNIAVSRADVERVNGFDEEFVGWGCEDDDFARRLRAAGVRIASVLGYTRAYHMWHPLDPTHPGQWNRGANVSRLLDAARPTRCRQGLATVVEGGVAAEKGRAA